MIPHQSSLLKQQMYVGQVATKGVHSSVSLEAGSLNRQQNSRSLQSRGHEQQPQAESNNLIYANQSSGTKQSINLRPSSAVRHQQHHQNLQSQQMKVKTSGMASNIKIKGAGSQQPPSRHTHNQSVAIVSQASVYNKMNLGSIENLNQVPPKKAQMHQKHQSMNTRSSNAQVNSTILNTSTNGSQSPSTLHRNKKALYRMLKK